MARIGMRRLRTGGKVVWVRPSRAERIDGRRLAWLAACAERVLLAPRPIAPGRRAAILFDTGGMACMRRMLPRLAPSAALICAMLQDLVRVMSLRAHDGRPLAGIVYDERFVLLDADARLRFVVAPLDGVPCGRWGSALGFVQAMVRLLGAPTNADDRLACERFRRFVASQGCALSLARLRAFVEAERSLGASATHAADAQGLRLWDLGANTSVRLEWGCTYTVGRDERCDVPLAGRRIVSRVHARITCANDGVVLEDMGSANGTFSGGRRLPRYRESYVGYGETFELAGLPFSVRVG